MSGNYKWYEAYKAAVLETDWSRMEERIRTAESSIKERKNDLSWNYGGPPEEMKAIEDAIKSLEVLRADAASWSERSKGGLGSKHGTDRVEHAGGDSSGL